MHTIIIDDDVYAVLMKNADPTVDETPNSVLRRLLLKKQRFGKK